MEVGKKGVVEGVGEADKGPYRHDEGCREGQLLGGEEGADMGEVYLFETTFENGGGVSTLFAKLFTSFEVGYGDCALLSAE